MKPFVKESNCQHRVGGKSEALKYAWQFMRDSFAQRKRKTRRIRRRLDKQNISYEK